MNIVAIYYIPPFFFPSITLSIWSLLFKYSRWSMDFASKYLSWKYWEYRRDRMLLYWRRLLKSVSSWFLAYYLMDFLLPLLVRSSTCSSSTCLYYLKKQIKLMETDKTNGKLMEKKVWVKQLSITMAYWTFWNDLNIQKIPFRYRDVVYIIPT